MLSIFFIIPLRNCLIYRKKFCLEAHRKRQSRWQFGDWIKILQLMVWLKWFHSKRHHLCVFCQVKSTWARNISSLYCNGMVPSVNLHAVGLIMRLSKFDPLTPLISFTLLKNVNEFLAFRSSTTNFFIHSSKPIWSNILCVVFLSQVIYVWIFKFRQIRLLDCDARLVTEISYLPLVNQSFCLEGRFSLFFLG